MEIQTRDLDGGLRFFETLREAMKYARENPDVWKVSLTLESGERLRLYRSDDNVESFCYSPIVRMDLDE